MFTLLLPSSYRTDLACSRRCARALFIAYTELMRLDCRIRSTAFSRRLAARMDFEVDLYDIAVPSLYSIHCRELSNPRTL